MYSIGDYGSMIADEARMGAFARALRQAITPGAVVVDIGTGTGIFALLACRFGARRVYAIEPDDAIQVAREMAAANGCADRIEFIQSLSTEVTLPERADVIVADIGGVLPWFQHHLTSMADARRRFLKPGGVLIPQCDVAWAAVVEAPEVYSEHTGPWRDNGFGLDMEAARRLVVNTWNKASVTPDNLLTPLQRWATTDYRVVEDPDIRATVTWSATRPGVGHGFVAGFDRTVADGIYLSNAPDAPGEIRPTRIYGTIFFPWPAPMTIASGDVVTVALEARLVRDDYIWNWKTDVLAHGPAGVSTAAFAQSTFLGAPLSPGTLHKQAASYQPTLSEDGRIASSILASMNDGVPLGEIARRLSAEFPARFRRVPDALRRVAELSRQYG
jgi:protein arginine N-methyltransferase 1